jgi:hypothetical protein
MPASVTHPAVEPQLAAIGVRAAIRRFVAAPSTAVAAAWTAIAVVGLAVWQLATVGTSVGDWDLLFVSGCLTVIGGLWLARGQSERFAAMLERLANRSALEKRGGPLSYEDVAEMHATIDARAEKWAGRGSVALAVLLAVAFVTVDATRGGVPLLQAIGGALAGALGGFLVGRPLGRMLTYSLLGRSLAGAKVWVRTTPGHIDGAAGLKPLGDYYLFQALLLALPAAFLLAWTLVLLIPSWDRRYSGWRDWYLGLLAAAICLEVVAFAAPLWRAHVVMKKQKRKALAKADRALGPAIAAQRAKLEQDLDNDERTAARDRLAQLTSSYEEIETMPTWPIDRSVRRRLTLANAALIVPLISEIAALAGGHS